MTMRDVLIRFMQDYAVGNPLEYSSLARRELIKRLDWDTKPPQKISHKQAERRIREATEQARNRHYELPGPAEGTRD
jgi:hypothetical protein